MPKLLANENVPRVAIHALRNHGHDVVWVAEVAKGAADTVIATHAEREQRVILTFDKDFGDLILRRQLAKPAGVVLCRFRAQSPELIAQLLTDLFTRAMPWEGHFTLVEETDVRSIPLP